jgi:LmbE family N-acetylglucosaminyl deacetylase
VLLWVWTPLQTVDRRDISDVIEDKLAAIRAHRTQCDVMHFDELCWASIATVAKCTLAGPVYGVFRHGCRRG